MRDGRRWGRALGLALLALTVGCPDPDESPTFYYPPTDTQPAVIDPTASPTAGGCVGAGCVQDTPTAREEHTQPCRGRDCATDPPETPTRSIPLVTPTVASTPAHPTPTEGRADSDEDGFHPPADCDDDDPQIHPGATETCDGVDEDCDRRFDEGAGQLKTYCVDGDGDGYGDVSQCQPACAQPSGYVRNGDDCDDGDAARHPGAQEICDGADEDCDSRVDEDALANQWCQDKDGDGLGDPDTAVEQCEAPRGSVACDPPDCDDDDPTVGGALGEEVCNEVDDDCDGRIDEALRGCLIDPVTNPDYDGDGYGQNQDCSPYNPSTYPGAPERCDSLDNDCDGRVDEAGGADQPTFCDDVDGDGFGSTAGCVSTCQPPAEGKAPAQPVDCADGDERAYPGAPELCDGIDNDCNSKIDEGLTGCPPANPDRDHDGYTITPGGDCDDLDPTTHPGAVEQCDLSDDDCDGKVDEGFNGCGPSPDVDWDLDGYTITGGDCDETDPTVNPGAEEQCNLHDDDCDGLADESFDGSCGPNPVIDWDGDGATHAQGDCDESDADVHPGADEVCNLKDDDCDGAIDEGVQDSCPLWCVALDGTLPPWVTPLPTPTGTATATEARGDIFHTPGLGPLTTATPYEGLTATPNELPQPTAGGVIGQQPTPTVCDTDPGRLDVDDDGVSLAQGDCDDLDADVHPGAPEQCNRRDDDCDGEIDEASAALPTPTEGATCPEGQDDCIPQGTEGTAEPPACTYTLPDDLDGDGIPIPQDCDDADATQGPGADERCNLKDDDCDGQVDEGLGAGCIVGGDDFDQDGFTTGQGDCNDANPSIHPGAEERCNFANDDCDLAIDEAFAWLCPEGDDDCDGVVDEASPGCRPGDDDCDTQIDEAAQPRCERLWDLDGDGWTPDDGDCDDAAADVHPGAPERCDAHDNDCDGLLNEDGVCVAFVDQDGDGFTLSEGDCDDNDDATWPGAPELCDGVDNDCDPTTPQLEDGCDGFYDDADGDGLTEAQGDCDDGDEDASPELAEICDNRKDDDCDGQADEGCPGIDDPDEDHDGYTLLEGDCDDYDPQAWPGAPEVCNGQDESCDGVADEGLECEHPPECASGLSVDEGDCDCGDADVYPGAEERCNRRDDDCDGLADEGLSHPCPEGDGDGDPDVDGDGYTAGEGDCDDHDAGVHPGAPERCDGKDNDCDGLPESEDGGCDVHIDRDGDGVEVGEGDCDDWDPTTHPGAAEACDGKDNDCDGGVDEGLPGCIDVYDLDFDGDGYTVSEGDCDDEAPGVHPDAAERCNGIDDDCDGYVDDDTISPCTLDGDDDADGDGVSPNQGDCDDHDPSVHPGAVDTCDLADTDCDGVVDDDFPCHGAPDSDGDGYVRGVDCDDHDTDVNPGAVEGCNGIDDDCDAEIDEGLGARCDYDQDGYTEEGGDCDDADPRVHPGAAETCDDVDNDCDGDVDEITGLPGAPDPVDIDGDGVPFIVYQGGVPVVLDCAEWDPTIPSAACPKDKPCDIVDVCDHKDNDCDGEVDELASGDDVVCIAWDVDEDGWYVPAYDESPPPGSDCSDRDPVSHPGAPEVCDGRDNDCDGRYDEGMPDECKEVTDLDNDGYTISGDPNAGGGDCNDLNPTTHPYAQEQCNLADDDCDGEIDEGLTSSGTLELGCGVQTVHIPLNDKACVLFSDLDGDGITVADGDCNDLDPQVYPHHPEICDQEDNDCDFEADEGIAWACQYNDDFDGDGWTVQQGDCDDHDPDTHPGAEELCDIKDNNCDGVLDELFDNDGDLFTACKNDCDDRNPDINPAEIEICNGIDDDCDGIIDNAPPQRWYRDDDRDGFGSDDPADQSIMADCHQPEWVLIPGDCDDDHRAINPKATEVCDGVDNNCDGRIDEGFDRDADGFTVCATPGNPIDCRDNDPRINACYGTAIYGQSKY